jgi:hypothetical protein
MRVDRFGLYSRSCSRCSSMAASFLTGIDDPRNHTKPESHETRFVLFRATGFVLIRGSYRFGALAGLHLLSSLSNLRNLWIPLFLETSLIYVCTIPKDLRGHNMSTLDPKEGGKRIPESSSAPDTQPDVPSVPSGQTFQVREGDRIVIDKRKFRPTFTTYKKRTIISIREK